MDLLASSVVGYLVAALQNRTVGAAAEQLLNLVADRLRDDPAVRRILTNEPERLNSDPWTIRRVELALEEEVIDDEAYGVKLRIVVERLDAGPTWRIGRIALDSESPCQYLPTSRHESSAGDRRP